MMIGQMYYRGGKENTLDKIEYLRGAYCPDFTKKIQLVLVHPDFAEEEFTLDKVKIKPSKEVIRNHFWFISENNPENYPKFQKQEK